MNNIEQIKHTTPIKHIIQLDSGSSDVRRTVIKQNSNETHILLISLYDDDGMLEIDSSWNIVISARKSDNKELPQNKITILTRIKIHVIPRIVNLNLEVDT